MEVHQADKHIKGLGCWDRLVTDQRVAMVHTQLSGAMSLRVLEAGSINQSAHHYRLGTGPLRRSTLADALARRKTAVFTEAARLLMSQAGRRLNREGAGFLYALDATTITLKGPNSTPGCAPIVPATPTASNCTFSASTTRKCRFRTALRTPNVNDIDKGVKLPITPEAVYAFDTGYCDYNGGNRPDQQRALFVSRFKRNASLRVERSLPIPAKDLPVVLHYEMEPDGGRVHPVGTAAQASAATATDHV